MIYQTSDATIIIEMGAGNVGIATLHTASGLQAIGFSNLTKNYEVGTNCVETEDTDPKNMPIKLVFKTRKNVEVLIMALQHTLQKFDEAEQNHEIL